MNALLCASLSILLLLAGCASPTKPDTIYRTETVRVPVSAPCVESIPQAPPTCVARDGSRPEWLRCLIVNKYRQDAYVSELAAVLKACATNP